MLNMMRRIDMKTSLLLVVLAVSLSVLASLVFFWFFNINTVYDVKMFSMDLTVMSTMGFHVGDDAIHFGHIPPGGGGMKEMHIEVGKRRTVVWIEAEGNISEWISISENDFVVEPFSNKSIEVFVNVPDDAPLNTYYEGNITVLLKNAL